MNYQEAKDNLSHIYDHVSRSEVYRGYRSLPVAATGVLALSAAVLQPYLIGVPDAGSFLLYWTAVAIVSVVMTGVPIVQRYRRTSSRVKRRKTRKAVGQLLPALILGACVTAAIYYSSPEFTMLMPGVWSVLFGLGIFSSRPFLPVATGAVAALYGAAGVVLLVYAPVLQYSPWTVGLTFGAGQFASAAVLYWNIERGNHE